MYNKEMETLMNARYFAMIRKLLPGLLLLALLPLTAESLPDSLKVPEGVNKAELERAYAEAKSKQLLFRTIYANVRPSVVKVVVVTRLKESPAAKQDPFYNSPFFRQYYNEAPTKSNKAVRSAGTGFIIDSEGTIITNSHVVHNASEVRIELFNGRKVMGKVRGIDNLTDVAVIKIPVSEDLKPVPIGDSEQVEVGDVALAVGNPYELDGTFTTGIISGVKRANLDASGMKFLQTDASINQGNSGGPLINIRGEVIGINRMIFSPSGGSIGLGFAIPIKDVQPVIARIIQTGRFDRPFLGVEIGALPPEVVSRLGRPGVFVTGVFKDSGAHKAGIQPRDILLSIDGSNLLSPEQLSQYVQSRKIGQSVQIQLFRKGQVYKVAAEIKQWNTIAR
ncbi:MAG: trypsin-like peptidase domain-containing protein [Leptospiraceae bacterium]|nr:trypsin-like peptidase domain-containing protein [Leptospiraceae bacterium]